MLLKSYLKLLIFQNEKNILYLMCFIYKNFKIIEKYTVFYM